MLLGVTDGVFDGVGVGLAGVESQHSSKLTLKTCSQHPSQSILTYISISVAVIPVQDVTPVILVDVSPV